jgi:hypothetical protein
MGILLIALTFSASIIWIYYEVNNKRIIEKYESWSRWWTFWLDSQERTGFIMFSVCIFLLSFAITSGIVKATVTEKFSEVKESSVLSYGGKGDSKFIVGRGNSTYIFYTESEKGMEKLELPESATTIKPNSFDGDATNSAILITNIEMKRVKRSSMPFMFFNKKDKVEEIGGCGCSGGKTYIVQVPSNFVFNDIKTK